MKIVSVIISAIAFLFSLSGCSGYPHSSWLEDDSLDKLAEKRCEDIVAALENKDSSAIKAMFSQKAIEEAEDLDDEIEYIIEHYEGSLKSFKGTTSTEENINGKSKKTTVKADYTVITDKQTYVLFFVEVSNTDDETENGYIDSGYLKSLRRMLIMGILMRVSIFLRSNSFHFKQIRQG